MKKAEKVPEEKNKGSFKSRRLDCISTFVTENKAMDYSKNSREKKEKKEIKEKNVFEFKSSSSDSVYKIRQNGDKLKCDCPGTWRAKDRRCKHIKEVEKKLNIKNIR